jgi:hypothetical protein
MTDTLRPKAIDRFLRQLRAGGRSNMYGAVPYIMKSFGVDRHTAFQLVCEWLDSQRDATAALENPRVARSGARSR